MQLRESHLISILKDGVPSLPVGWDIRQGIEKNPAMLKTAEYVIKYLSSYRHTIYKEINTIKKLATVLTPYYGDINGVVPEDLIAPIKDIIFTLCGLAKNDIVASMDFASSDAPEGIVDYMNKMVDVNIPNFLTFNKEVLSTFIYESDKLEMFDTVNKITVENDSTRENKKKK